MEQAGFKDTEAGALPAGDLEEVCERKAPSRLSVSGPLIQRQRHLQQGKILYPTVL